MIRFLIAVFLVSTLGACECCPETSSGLSQNSCCCNNGCDGGGSCGGVAYQ